MLNRLLLSFFLLAVFVCSAGCGLKGPLYRTDEPQVVAPAAGSDATSTDGKKLQRPRPAPQAQKEPQSAREDRTVPAAPIGEDNADTNPRSEESLPADSTR